MAKRKRTRRTRPDRRLTVRGELRPEPDMRKLARVLLALAGDRQAEAATKRKNRRRPGT